MRTKITSILLCLFLFACGGGKQPVQLPDLITDVVDGQPVVIRIDKGTVTVEGGEDGQVRVGGQTLFPDQTAYSVTTVNGQIQITANYSGSQSSAAQLHLVIGIPNHIGLAIETDSASIAVRNYTGALPVTSVSGDILVEDVQGDITLHSNRGNITVQNSSGKISVVGNYGLLNIKNTSGETAASTIMGNVQFDGLIGVGDVVRFETDHGAVSTNLRGDSSLALQVRSTTGDLACMLPGIKSTTRTCDGEIASGDGSLSIRTVSGPVTLRLLP